MRFSKNRFLQLLGESVDGSEFPWPDAKPWWANSAIAAGAWDKDENLIYDLTEKHEDYMEKYEDAVESLSADTATVTPGEAEIKQKKGLFRGRKRKGEKEKQLSKKASASDYVSKEYGLMGPDYGDWSRIDIFELTKVDLVKNILVPRYFIASSLNRFGSPKGKEFYKALQKDCEELVGKDMDDQGYGKSRYDKLWGAIQDLGREDMSLSMKWDSWAKENLGSKSSAKVQAGEMEGVYIGDDSADMIYTLKNDKMYAYRKNPDTPKGWEYILQKDLKAGKTKFKPIKAGKKKLDDAESSGDLEVNPAMAELISGGQLSEGLSRGSLYRRRYRRY